jgi:opacity protein-like surface antigen
LIVVDREVYGEIAMKNKHKTVWSMTIPLASGLAGVAIAPSASAKVDGSKASANLTEPAAGRENAVGFSQSLDTPDLTQQPKLKRRANKDLRLTQAMPTDPTAPANPTDPTMPTNPTAPTDRTNPTTPTNPTAPMDGTNPTTPTTPTGPTDGTTPTNPTTPTAPTDGTTPTTPTTPTAPTDGTTPTNPTAPPAVPGAAPTSYFYVGGVFGGAQVDPYSLRSGGGDARIESFRSAIYGPFVGYRFGDVRVEVEANRTVAELQSSSVASLRGSRQNNTYMLNAYYDLPLSTQIKPFIGAGIGLMDSSFSGTATVPGAPPSIVGVNGSKSGLAYQLKAGISYGLDSKTDIFLQYRYLSSPSNSLGEGQINDFSSQSFEGGIRIGL